MDANKDAFGREKNGVPNRPVAAEIMSVSENNNIQVRWAATHGEQFHSKVLRIRSADTDMLLLGSANWTRRNLANYNLEANLLLLNAQQVGQDFDLYFDSIWSNAQATESLDYTSFADDGWFNRYLYRFQEWSGLSTF